MRLAKVFIKKRQHAKWRRVQLSCTQPQRAPLVLTDAYTLAKASYGQVVSVPNLVVTVGGLGWYCIDAL